MHTANIFVRPMTVLRKVTLTPAEMCDGITVTTIGAFLDPRWQANYSAQIAAIRRLCPSAEAKERNKDRVNRMKIELPAGVLSAVLSGGMGQEDVTQCNGVACFDVDAQDNPAIHDWQAFKLELAKSKFIAYAGLSVSGLGVFLLIPIADPSAHEAHYMAIVEDLKKATFSFSQDGDTIPTVLHGVNCDPIPCNIASKRFVSFDPLPVCNTSAQVYERMAVKPQPVRMMMQSFSGSWSLEEWLHSHDIQYNVRERQGGQQYVVRCPWAHLHSSSSKADSALFVHPDGAVGYKCQHAHCAGKGWREYRAYYETAQVPKVFSPDAILQAAGLSVVPRLTAAPLPPPPPPTACHIFRLPLCVPEPSESLWDTLTDDEYNSMLSPAAVAAWQAAHPSAPF